jgi:hypothetical protein
MVQEYMDLGTANDGEWTPTANKLQVNDSFKEDGDWTPLVVKKSPVVSFRIPCILYPLL